MPFFPAAALAGSKKFKLTGQSPRRAACSPRSFFRLLLGSARPRILGRAVPPSEKPRSNKFNYSIAVKNFISIQRFYLRTRIPRSIVSALRPAGKEWIFTLRQSIWIDKLEGLFDWRGEVKKLTRSSYELASSASRKSSFIFTRPTHTACFMGAVSPS